MGKRFYLDNNATTPVRPEVVEAMLPYMTETFGNSFSVHWFGREAKKGLEASREKVARCIGADPEEIIFTGCGTESDNIAITGYLSGAPKEKNGLVTMPIEHSAILKTAEMLTKNGFPVTFVDVDNNGVVNMDSLKKAVGRNTGLVSIMHANNETGALQPIEEIARIVHEAEALFHTDAVQSAGKVPIHVRNMDIDMLSMSAHKMNAQKGVGGLYLRKGVTVNPVMYGGSHESGLRPGTVNVAGIVGFAKAFELMVSELKEKTKKMTVLRDKLERSLTEKIPNILINSKDAPRLPGTSNICFPGVDGEALLVGLDMEGIAVSSGSACASGKINPSHVLIAMGVPPQVAQTSVRFSMGWGTTDEAIEHVIAVMPRWVERLRKVSGNV